VLPDELDIFVPKEAHQRAEHQQPLPREREEQVEMQDCLARASAAPQDSRERQTAQHLAQHQVSLEQQARQPLELLLASQQQEHVPEDALQDELRHEHENVQENVQPSPVPCLELPLRRALPQDAPPDLPKPLASPPSRELQEQPSLAPSRQVLPLPQEQQPPDVPRVSSQPLPSLASRRLPRLPSPRGR
jgi:hypothetical protein